MKTRYILTVALAVVAFTGCQKEKVDSNRLQLIAEGMGSSGAKLAVNNEKSYWVADENVRINDVEGKVVVNPNEDGSAYVNKSDVVSAPYCGVYPASIYSSNSTTIYTLNLPDSYRYTTTTFNGKTMQNLASPMVAYAAGGSTLTFKHVTAAIGVQIVNYHYDYDIVVDQVQVISNKYRLHGEAEVDLTADDLGLTPETGSTAAERTVTMTFDGGATLVIPRGGSAAIVQVPVLPVDSDNKFTVSITVHRSDNASVTATLRREQASAHSLGRAKIGYAMYTLGGPFTVNGSGKKVIFSKGNLQYNANSTNAGTAPYTPAWRFAPNQYDHIGSGNNNIAENYYGWIDLFGWGTGNNPTKHTTVVSDYTSYNEWGTAAAASLGSGWYTLTNTEWGYLTTGSRTTMTTGLASATGSTTAKFKKATVNSVSGLIIFPDNYVHPDDVNITLGGDYNSTSSTFDQFTVNSGWDKMELAGAIFLPTTGYRNGTIVDQENTYGYYWSQTKTAESGYSLYFISSTMNANNFHTNASLDKGHSVRLVKNAN